MERFALKVDLSEILDDVYHQKVMILVDPQWPTVAEVGNKIKEMFNILIKIGFKTSDDFFIPMEEPVEILKYVNMLIAFKVEKRNETKSKQARKISPSIIEPEIITTAEYASKKKRKYGFLNEENFTTSTPNVAKRLKNLSPTQAELSPVSESFNLSEKRKKSKSKTKSPDKALQESSRKTTKNIVKEKNKSLIISEIENIHSKSESHIFFDSKGQEKHSKVNTRLETNNEEMEKSKMEVVFLCELTDSELTGRGRSFQIEKPTTEAEKAKQDSNGITLESNQSHVLIPENVTLVKEVNGNSVDEKSCPTVNSIESKMSCLEQSTKPTESLISFDESAVIELNETERTASQNETNLTSQQETECSSLNETKASEPNESSSVIDTESSLKSIPLTDLPNLNDRLIFKIMLTNNKISENFLGICEYVNKRTKSIKIHLIDGHSQIRYLPQKYAGNIDDSNGVTILNVKLQDMFEPKVLQT